MVSSMVGVLIRTSVAMIKCDGQKNRDKRFISFYILQVKSGQELKIGTDAESMMEHSVLTCLSWLDQFF